MASQVCVSICVGTEMLWLYSCSLFNLKRSIGDKLKRRLRIIYLPIKVSVTLQCSVLDRLMFKTGLVVAARSRLRA